MSENDMALKTREDMAEAITDKALETAAQLHKIYEPQWNSRADVLKTIVSLSSGSIVLSVTFSSSLRALQVDPFWKYLVVFSFAMLVVSLVLAFVALRTGTKLYQTQSNIFESWKEIYKMYIDTPSQEDFVKAFKDTIQRAFSPIEKSDKLAARLFRFSSACFCLAIISLAVVGAMQLLS
jgi:hypothetical protein